MSLEQSIADLVAIGGENLDLPEDFSDLAVAKINELKAAFAEILANGFVERYVDQANGLDTNAGTLAAPYKTIDKVLSLTPYGGHAKIFLKGPYHFSANLSIDGRFLALYSSSGTRHALTFERVLRTDLSPNLREVKAFFLRGAAALGISGLTLNVPALDGAWGGYSVTNGNFLFRAPDGMPGNPVSVAIVECNIAIPSPRFCQLFGSSFTVSFQEHSNTLTGAVTDLNGCIMQGTTATGGTASNTVPNIVSNRATI